ncbi:hypothetical protein [Cellulomonas cellasea]|uniref:Uncharacterized protein n=1 Tax=Cellulomonas cellasea TaxID=43670 RepID=A0A7W4UFG9_9CELL|nr:hypothetical protein [Cellulomonas cellasea]MBB2923233.1 hypothetical protein [Cellulomonas cellasea]
MRKPRHRDQPLSVLDLQLEVNDADPDRPVVRVLVNGNEPFEDVVPGWRGFDPDAVLGETSPLLPVDGGRRVAVSRCSCTFGGCGVVAPLVVPSRDGRRVSWVDPRDWTDVFDEPLGTPADDDEGLPWPIPDLHFDRAQYVAEIRRASRDRSWETPRRRTARRLRERLEAASAHLLPPDLRLDSVGPGWREPGFVLTFARTDGGGDYRYELLVLTSAHDDPERASEDMAHQLLAVDPADRVQAFGRPL